MLTMAAAAACGAIMSVSDLSDHTLDALLDHLGDYDLPMILARLAD